MKSNNNKIASVLSIGALLVSTYAWACTDNVPNSYVVITDYSDCVSSFDNCHTESWTKDGQPFKGGCIFSFGSGKNCVDGSLFTVTQEDYTAGCLYVIGTGWTCTGSETDNFNTVSIHQKVSSNCNGT